MKAIMSERVKKWSNSYKTKKELSNALDALSRNNGEPTEVIIDNTKYIIKSAKLR